MGYEETTSGPQYLAFDIGGTKIASALVTLPQQGADELDQGRPIVEDRQSIPTQASLGGDSIRCRLVDKAAALLDKYTQEGKHVVGVGIAAAGVPDTQTGEIVAATDILPGWRGQRIYDAFKQVTDLPVTMIGDVGGHGLGEAMYGAGRGYKTVLSIGVGTGIGGALITQGHLLTGAHGVAGHAGHLASGLAQGFRCSCGATSGHIESVASGTGIAALYNRYKPSNISEVANGYDVCVLAGQADSYACETLARSARALGECIGGMANLVDPHIVVISGSVVQAGEIWWNALREGFNDSALELVKQTPMVEGNLGGAAPLIGAAYAAHSYRLV